MTSVLGQGSSFWFTARLKRGSSSLPFVDRVAGRTAEDILIHRFQGCRILLVEDDYINRAVALELLSNIRLNIDIAEDGLVALEKVQRNEYSLVLMDMQMPHMDGLEATRRIRHMSNRKLLPILAMTANAYAEDRQRCMAAGMNDFIAKPIDPDMLFETMLRWLSATESPLAL